MYSVIYNKEHLECLVNNIWSAINHDRISEEINLHIKRN